MMRGIKLYCLLILLPFIVLAGCQGERRKGAVTQVPSREVKRTPKKEPPGERKLAKDKGIELEGLGREDPFLPVSGERRPQVRPATLTLAGVVGDAALLTKGDREWIVKVGDIVEDKRVQEIGEDGVILINEAGEETVVR